jgi:hypothetical protein
MSRPIAPRKTKKLLVASIGVGTLVFASCAVFPGCNLMAPPSCLEDPEQLHCRDQGVPDQSVPDLRTKTQDLSESD